jgi:hypothetical protein
MCKLILFKHTWTQLSYTYVCETSSWIYTIYWMNCTWWVHVYICKLTAYTYVNSISAYVHKLFHRCTEKRGIIQLCTWTQFPHTYTWWVHVHNWVIRTYAINWMNCTWWVHVYICKLTAYTYVNSVNDTYGNLVQVTSEKRVEKRVLKSGEENRFWKLNVTLVFWQLNCVRGCRLIYFQLFFFPN